MRFDVPTSFALEVTEAPARRVELTPGPQDDSRKGSSLDEPTGRLKLKPSE